MRRMMVVLTGGGLALFGSWSPGAHGSVLPGLSAGLGLGLVVLLLLGAAGASLGRLLQQTRLEDQVMSVTLFSSASCSSDDRSVSIDEVAAWLRDPTVGERLRRIEGSRRFVWDDELPPVETLAEIER